MVVIGFQCAGPATCRADSGGDLFLVGGDSVTRTQPDGAYCRDFGVIAAASTTSLQQVFTLQNIQSTPVTIDGLRPSCRCTTPTLYAPTSSGGFQVMQLPCTVPPGATVRVAVTVSLAVAGYNAGTYHKLVSVAIFPSKPPPASSGISAQIFGGPPGPVLEMIYRILPAVTFSPAIVLVNHLEYGSGAIYNLSAAVDRQSVGSIPAPLLASSNPYVTVAKSPTTGSADPEIDYAVSVNAGAPIGPLYAELSFEPAPGQAASPLMSIWESAKAVVTGSVVGDVAAVPQSISFGQIASGATATQSAVLTGAALALAGASIATHADWIRATLSSMSGTTTQSARTLTLTVPASAPIGLHQSSVELRLGGAEQLTIPVSVYIAAQ